MNVDNKIPCYQFQTFLETVWQNMNQNTETAKLLLKKETKKKKNITKTKQNNALGQ